MQVELHILRMPLVRPFATSQSVTTAREVLLVRALTDDGEGWGECSADDVPAMVELFRQRRVDDHPMAAAALEMATLDARLRAEGVSLADHLGGTRTAIDSTATIGFEDDIDEYVAAGYRSLKLKIAPDRLPAGLPPGVRVQADANGSFAGCPERVDALDDLGLVCIEQPLAADDLGGHADLVRRLRTAICLDESIASVAQLDDAIAAGACDAVCVKPSRLGGLAAAQAIHDRCVEADLVAKVGGMLETGVGRAAALALASLPGFGLPADLSASDRYWEEDVTPPFVLDRDGRLPVPTGPGLGVTIRMDVIKHYSVSVELIRLD